MLRSTYWLLAERVSAQPRGVLHHQRVGEGVDRAGEDGHQHGLRVRHEGRQVLFIIIFILIFIIIFFIIFF